MVLGLVYTEVNSNSVPWQEHITVREHLNREILNVNRVQLGSQSEPEVVYANPAGRSLLRSVQATERNVLRLQEQLHIQMEVCTRLNEEQNNLQQALHLQKDACKRHNEDHSMLKDASNQQNEEHSKLKDAFNQQNEDHSMLKDAFNQQNEEHSQLKDACNRQNEDHSMLKDAFNQQNEEHSKLKDAFNQQNEEHSQLKDAFNQHNEEHSKLKDAFNQQNEEHNSLKEKFEIHQVQCKKHEMELAVLRPLRDPAVGIRARFFLNYEKHQRSNRGSHCPEDPRILAGNNIAHGGDVMTDIVLLRNNLIKFLLSFKALYGLFLDQADQLTVYPHMVTVMNRRATVIANSRCDWTKETEDKFLKLVEWTRVASPKALHEFTEDFEGKTAPRRQFYELENFKPSRH